MLGPPGHARLDLGLAQVRRYVLDDFLQENVAPGGALRDQPGDLVVALREHGGEGQVLKFPLDGVHAQPVRERREYLQHLARLLLLLRPGQVAERPHIVQAVRELDDQDPDVAGHRDHHLAHGLGLGGIAVLDLVQLGHAVDQLGDLVAELAAQLGEGIGGVLDGVMQQRGADRLVVHAELGEDRGHRQRMGDVRVAAVPPLAGMLRRGDLVRVLYHPHVGLRMRRLDRLDQRLEYRVDAAARRSEPGQPAPDGGRPDRPVGGRRPGRGRRGGPALRRGRPLRRGLGRDGVSRAGLLRGGLGRDGVSRAGLLRGGLSRDRAEPERALPHGPHRRAAGRSGGDRRETGPPGAGRHAAHPRAAGRRARGAFRCRFARLRRGGGSDGPGWPSAAAETPEPAGPAVTTSPATYAPHVRRASSLSADDSVRAGSARKVTPRAANVLPGQAAGPGRGGSRVPAGPPPR